MHVIRPRCIGPDHPTIKVVEQPKLEGVPEEGLTQSARVWVWGSDRRVRWDIGTQIDKCARPEAQIDLDEAVRRVSEERRVLARLVQHRNRMENADGPKVVK